MQVANITYRNNTKIIPTRKTISFSSGGGVIDDGDYVKIPKKNYQRDKILGYIVNTLIYTLCAAFGKGNNPFP